MKPAEVWDLCIEYQDVEYTNFRSNLSNLQKAVTKQGNKAKEDDATIAHDQ
jgi:hypothetical protein